MIYFEKKRINLLFRIKTYKSTLRKLHHANLYFDFPFFI